MSGGRDAYTSLIRAVERAALVTRYVLLGCMLALFLLGYIRGRILDVWVISSVVLAHNAFSHWVLWTGRYSLFTSRFNFVLYLAEITVLVAFSGGDESPAFVLYILFLAGLGAYRHDFRQILMITALCCAAYAGVLAAEWRLAGLSRPFGELAFKQLVILSAGWLAATLSRRLRDAEYESFNRAQRLATSEAALRMILDHAADPILVLDEDEFIIDANDTACTYFGLARDRILGQRLRSFLFDDGTLPQKLAAMRRRGQFHGEMLMMGTDGEERSIDVRVRSFIRDDKQYYVALGHDITPQKELQEVARQTNLRLERLNRELGQVNELRTAFMANISLTLRSPLAAVLGYIEMLLQDELGGLNRDQRKALQTCRRGTLRAFRIIDDALALRRDKEPPHQAEAAIQAKTYAWPQPGADPEGADGAVTPPSE